jgi:2-keto-3-deoxy-L-rhamnonate aldolase RhmA
MREGQNVERLEQLKSRLASKKPVVGAAVVLSDMMICEALGQWGFDFVWIDGEHGPMDHQTILRHIVAANAGGAAAFVRVAWNDAVRVKPILEMGPDGIIFPFIRTAKEATEAVRACTYPPAGVRGWGPLRSIRYGMTDAREYAAHAGKAIWKIMQIEHVEAVQNAAEILAVEGVDAVIVGPNDLSGSLGKLGMVSDPAVREQFEIVAKKAAGSNKPLGVAMGLDPKYIRFWLDHGASFFCISVDMMFMMKAAREALAEMHSLFSEKA